ncbi:MAG TPA: hypothetical protein VGS27_22525 [Candidatus Sulfotelmatobacter sp.]|nr:hypothetical protein [Candidatus Sulfotelmatobacter sp.]
MRRFLLVLFIVALAGVACAQVPSGNVFFGYSYYNANPGGSRSSFNGWNGSIEGKFLPFIGVVGDFSGYYGSQGLTYCTTPILDCITINNNLSEQNYLFGPRVSFSVGRFRPFAEGFIGAAHLHVNGGASQTSFATAVGGGLDYKFLKLLAWRFEGDYVHTNLFKVAQNNVRVSTGLVLRF